MTGHMRVGATKGMVLALLAAMLLTLSACGDKKTQTAESSVTLPVENGAVIGTGSVSFAMEIKDQNGQVTAFTVKTDE